MQLKDPRLSLLQFYLYEAVCRMMAGANPSRTQELLERSTLRQRITSQKQPQSVSTKQEDVGTLVMVFMENSCNCRKVKIL